MENGELKIENRKMKMGRIIGSVELGLADGLWLLKEAR
jgi:hypothetical protein